MIKIADLSVSRDSALGRAFATFLQFLVGLVVVVVGVPGVTDAVTDYVRQNLVQVLGSLGLTTSLVTFLNNVLRPSVPTK